MWNRLDRQGHDAALLESRGDGWLLVGAAVFAHDAGPSSFVYRVETDPFWRTKRGSITGFLAGKTVECDIAREDDGWRLNGEIVGGLEHLLDLDLSFTPATNILQLRRAGPGVGQTARLPAAWFDVERASLEELPQTYERRAETAYWYAAPTVPYQALIETAASGFIQSYPGLWRLVDGG
jgi:hypothetical protein